MLRSSEVHTGSSENIDVRDNPSELRYELLLGEDVVGEIQYRLAPDAVVLVHTHLVVQEPEVQDFGKTHASRCVASGNEARADLRTRETSRGETPP